MFTIITILLIITIILFIPIFVNIKFFTDIQHNKNYISIKIFFIPIIRKFFYINEDLDIIMSFHGRMKRYILYKGFFYIGNIFTGNIGKNIIKRLKILDFNIYANIGIHNDALKTAVIVGTLESTYGFFYSYFMNKKIFKKTNIIKNFVPNFDETKAIIFIKTIFTINLFNIIISFIISILVLISKKFKLKNKHLNIKEKYA